MVEKVTGPRKKVDAVERALSILDVFDKSEPRLSLSEVAKRTGLYPSTVLRLAGSLEYWGYLCRDQSGDFRLGPTLLRLGTLYQNSFDLSEVVRPVLKNLSDETGETSAFYVREGDARMCLYRHHSVHPLRHHIDEGVQLPLDKGAGGHILSAYTGHTSEASAEIKKDGFSVSYGEREPETAAVSVPVFGGFNGFLGALTLVGPMARMKTNDMPALIKILQDAAERIRVQLSGGRHLQ